MSNPIKYSELQGSWRLLNISCRYTDNDELFYPMGEDVEGMLIYTDDQFISVHVQSQNRD